ncbi:SDR family oxidoreductase [Pseudohongiella sp.]|uniref:Ketoreductase domain-containing protein n=1 Tax=marine sediment metagenome TaxID=412755 RepID=A0A0F9W0Q7_9ZZZZ|nr:SDR family oxidoreductase [Pseudohongiella sp.]HDZ08338.1 SDR family oxidoreductase [Pseudohongiella sp.]HEA61941.1 SDR family oxidoreductase [Pseudohongiella sp.]
MRLQDSVVLLTGATGGMGQAILAQLVAAGARLTAVGRDTATLIELDKRYGDSISTITADLRVPEDRQRLAQTMQSKVGFNLLINAAGVNDFALFENQDDEQISGMININLTATMLVTKSMLPLLKQAPESCVVMVGSTFGAIGYPGFASYCATKFALRGFSEALRRELADTRVSILYLAPRATLTDMNSTAVEEMNAALGVKMDSPEKVARCLVKSLQRNLSEVHLGYPERVFIRLNGLMPQLVSRSLRKQLSTIRQFATTRVENP